MGGRSLRPLTVCIAFAVLASAYPAQASKVYLTGTSYQLRNGQQEGSQDLVTPWPPQWSAGPYCFKMDTEIGVSVVADSGENIRRWKVTGARLYSIWAGDYVWTVGEGPWKEPGQTYALGDLPPWIDVVWLEGDVVIEEGVATPPPVGGDSAAGGATVTDSFGKCSYIYVVLDQPKAPMAPAWTGVLSYSCIWAMGEDTPLGANTALTDMLYAHGSFNGGFEAYTSGSTNDGETLHLKSLLDAGANPLRGQCTDFADFLGCLSTSVGASEMKSQRSNPLPPPAYPVLETRSLTPAGASGSSAFYWRHHTFGVVSDAAWDACVSIVGYGVPKDWPRDTTYRNRLVREYREGWSWLPTPVSCFAPTVTTAPVPR